MAVYRRTRPRFVLLLLVLSALTIVTLDGRGQLGLIDGARRVSHDVMAPIARGADRVTTPVGDWLGGVARSGSLRRDNAQLRRRVRELENRVRQRSELARENDELTRLLQLSQPYAAAVGAVTARVFAGSPGNFASTVEIDKGRDYKIAVDMPVISADGLAGRVVDVSNHSATVRLITDSTVAVGIRFVDSGETAVAQGTGTPLMGVDLVDINAAVGVGALAVTSGLQHGIYPPGIPVGVVSKATKVSGHELQKPVTLRPVARLSRLDVVRVLKYQRPAR